jgi:hypothetical protein
LRWVNKRGTKERRRPMAFERDTHADSAAACADNPDVGVGLTMYATSGI